MQRRRPNVLPPGVTVDAYLSLQAEWDERARRSGLKDIEYGYDVNELPASTLRAPGTARKADETRTSGGNVHVALDDVSEVVLEVAAREEHETARFWRMAGQAAHALPRNARHRRFILLTAEIGSASVSARRLGIAWSVADRWWRAFLLGAGLLNGPWSVKRDGRPPRPRNGAAT